MTANVYWGPTVCQMLYDLVVLSELCNTVDSASFAIRR